MNKNAAVWLIIPQTNLHVGNESVVSFGVIDKAIQRDVTTQLPCINSSSLKGAVKEFLTEELCFDENKIVSLFGSVKKKGNTSDTQKGAAIFFDANLLFLPQQCTDGNEVYQLTYSDEVIHDFLGKAENLGIVYRKENITNKLTNVAQKSISKDAFAHICKDESLPIIARNCLDNGESVNLWYEQVLPSKSVLAVIIATPNKDDLDVLDGKIVQIGANATIGYGYCKFVKL